MPARPLRLVAAVVFSSVLIFSPSAGAQTGKEWVPSGKAPAPGGGVSSGTTVDPSVPRAPIEAVVVNPYKSANVGTQVSGIIQRFHFDEGDFVQSGQIVAEIEPTRYMYLTQRADERVKALEAALKQAEEEAGLRDELVNMNASTRREVLKAKSEAEIARHKLEEARKELDLARFDLDACKIMAPFSGHLAVRYKQPDETVDRLEKTFAIVDSSKVLAVANVPENRLDEFKIGMEASFVYSPDKSFRGKVERIGKLIDPKSKTKRVYLLLDNSSASLEVGMTGSLQLVK
jgi:RND family efflux transporter MFP subunit